MKNGVRSISVVKIKHILMTSMLLRLSYTSLIIYLSYKEYNFIIFYTKQGKSIGYVSYT